MFKVGMMIRWDENQVEQRGGPGASLVIRAHFVAARRAGELEGGLCCRVGGSAKLGRVLPLEGQVSLEPACAATGSGWQAEDVLR